MIREFKKSDIDSCAKIMQAVYNNEMWQCRWTDETACSYLRDIVENTKFIGFCVAVNDEVIGAILCREKVWWNNSELYIEEMFILPQHQRHGYGSRLMNAIEDHVKHKRLAGLTLSTSKYSFAPDFYRKNGFEVAEPVVFMYKVLGSDE